MVHYKTVLDIRQFKGGPKKFMSRQKCIDYTEKWPILVIFLYNPYIFGYNTVVLLYNFWIPVIVL